MFKLVRIDDEGHQEIPLSDGKQVIGRGNLLQCDDKRVSRNHAELEIVDDSIIVKALHINPCFIVKNKMGEAKIINQNMVIKVNLGDKIGFLNDKFWYNISKNNEMNDICLSVEDFQPLKDIINKHKDIGTLNYDTTSEDCNKSEKKLPEEHISNETVNEEYDDKASVSPSILNNLKTQEQILNNESKDQQSNEIKSEEQSDDGLSQSPGKRSLIKQELTSPVDIKKLKTEDNAEEKPQSPASQASTSSGASSASISSPSKEQKPKRERCMYGEKCYRKNPQHKAQFSHPGDCDWGSGAQAPCPWGYACARRDPRHWRDHSHPYGMHPPPPQGRRKKRTKRSSSGETPVEDLILTGKRSRKTIQRETWSGSESEEEDPYGTDDSDDWQPPSDVSETQDYSQASQL